MKTLSKQVAKVVQASNGRNTKQVIDDLIQMMSNIITEPLFIERAFENTLWTYGSDFRNELSYYKKHPKAWDELQNLSLMFMQAIKESEPFSDVVGLLYDLELKGNEFGQFLTPPDVAETIGMLNVCMSKEPTELVNVGDMTGCGAGGMLLGFIRAYIKKFGKDSTKYLCIHALDIDMNMVRMTTVQIVLNSCIHRMPINSFVAHNCNVITEYEAMNEGNYKKYLWMPAQLNEIYNAGLKMTQEQKAKLENNIKNEEPEMA